MIIAYPPSLSPTGCQCPELAVCMQNRLMLSRISSAVLVHTKGLAPRLLAARYSRMAYSNSAVLR